MRITNRAELLRTGPMGGDRHLPHFWTAVYTAPSGKPKGECLGFAKGGTNPSMLDEFYAENLPKA
jgi:hypothetical protein